MSFPVLASTGWDKTDVYYCDRALPCLNTIHLSCLNSRHLSCLSSRHLSCLNSRHLSCLNRRHLSCLNRRRDSCRPPAGCCDVFCWDRIDVFCWDRTDVCCWDRTDDCCWDICLVSTEDCQKALSFCVFELATPYSVREGRRSVSPSIDFYNNFSHPSSAQSPPRASIGLLKIRQNPSVQALFGEFPSG